MAKRKKRTWAKAVAAPTRQPKGARFYNTPVFLDCDSPKKGCKITRRPAGAKIASFPNFRYTTQAKPCAWQKSKPRKTCPVQLFYKDGQPTLRFCLKRNTAGKTLTVDSPREAQRIASEACRCWEKSHKTVSKRSFKNCSVLKGAGLGGKKRKRKKR